MKLTKELLLKYFRYEDGKLIWIKSRKKRFIGRVAGCVGSNGYVKIRVFGKDRSAHRLIWIICKGYIPTMIDHINGDRSDNRIENLRETNPSLNQKNKTPWNRIKTSEYRGVSYDSYNKKWLAYHNRAYLGGYDTEHEAFNAKTNYSNNLSV